MNCYWLSVLLFYKYCGFVNTNFHFLRKESIYWLHEKPLVKFKAATQVGCKQLITIACKSPYACVPVYTSVFQFIYS